VLIIFTAVNSLLVVSVPCIKAVPVTSISPLNFILSPDMLKGVKFVVDEFTINLSA